MSAKHEEADDGFTDRKAVKTWDDDELFGDGVAVVTCEGEDGLLIGLDIVAEDHTVFAHTHFDIATAEALVRDLEETIAAVKAYGRPN